MILDALRKADAERERGAVPGLNAQPVAPLSNDAAPPARTLPWQWIAIVALFALVIALAWFTVTRESPQPPPAVSVAAPAAPSEPASRPAEVQPSADRALSVAPAAPWPQPRAHAAPEPPAAASAAPPTATAAPLTREQLPDSVRAALPALAVGGSMYSNNPANRTLIVNGALYRENDQVTADLALEQIGQKTAIFRFRGYRVEVPY